MGDEIKWEIIAGESGKTGLCEWRVGDNSRREREMGIVGGNWAVVAGERWEMGPCSGEWKVIADRGKRI